MAVLFGDGNSNYNSKFSLGKKVTLKGYEGRIFTIEKQLGKDVFYRGKIQSELAYTLKDIKMGELIIGYPEDMKLYSTYQERQDEINKVKDIVDSYLDTYNDKLELYKAFGDDRYKVDADEILELLREYTNEHKELIKGDLNHEKAFNY